MSVKAKLEKIEKQLKEEEKSMENPTRGDLDLIRLAFTNEFCGNEIMRKKQEKFKKIWEREYRKFNGSYDSFINYLVGTIQTKIRKICEEPEK